MTNHHRDPDEAFYGWNDVWLDPEFPNWSITSELERITVSAAPDPGRPRPVRNAWPSSTRSSNAQPEPTQRIHLDCQHSPPTELPEETAEAIKTWLSSLSPAGT